MATQKPCNSSCGSLPLFMDFIDLTVESPVHRSSETSSSSRTRSRRPLDRKPETFVLHKDDSNTLDATVTVTTGVAPTIRLSSTNESRSGTRSGTRSGARRVIRSYARVRSTITASNKSKSGRKNQFKNEAKPDEIINLDDTVLPEPSNPQHENYSNRLICAICLEELLSQCKPTATRCGHIFCEECLNRAMIKIKLCPQCRRSITKKSCIRLHF